MHDATTTRYEAENKNMVVSGNGPEGNTKEMWKTKKRMLHEGKPAQNGALKTVTEDMKNPPWHIAKHFNM